ncbi:MAG: hypothetical protein ABFC98_00155 [Candidatus Cloacimonas sp.]
MKKFILTIFIIGMALSIFAVSIGKIRFMVGEVQYKASANLTYKKATLHSDVQPEGYIKTGPDSKAEIQWNNGSVSIIDANTEININKLETAALSNPDYKNKMWNRISALRVQSNQRTASNVAGIRREEAEFLPESQLFWFSEPHYKIEDALTYFDNKDYAKAADLFEKIVEQAPLSKDAELSHTCLILIYDQLGDGIKLKKHIQQLKEDFPDSSTLDSLPPEN